MNILIAINKKYVLYAKTMLRSLVDTNRVPIDVYILNYELREKDINNIRKSITRKNVKIHSIRIENKIFEKYSIPEQFSEEIFLRLLAYQFLPLEVERVLWLDSDMIILNDLSELYKHKFDNRMMIVCEDIGCNEVGVMEKRRKRLENMEINKYFNSGMLLMNLKKMREKFDMEEVFNILNKHNSNLIYPDQDILNIMLWNDVIYVDENKYNKQVFSYQNKDINEIKKNTSILHYVGKIKPWNFRYEGCTKTIYYDVLKKIDIKFYYFIKIKQFMFKMKYFLKGCKG